MQTNCTFTKLIWGTYNFKAITEKVENIVGSGKGGSVLVHVGTNNVDR